jgi:hypothetical protein
MNGTGTLKAAPVRANLQANGTLPVINLAIDFSSGVGTVLSTYVPDPSVALQTGYTIQGDPGAADAEGFYTLKIKNLTITVPGLVCGDPLALITDLWTTTNANTPNWTPQCVSCGNFFGLNYPRVAAFITCGTPFTYFARITNPTNQAINVRYKTYVDRTPIGSFGSEDLLVDEQATPVAIPVGETYLSPAKAWVGSNGASGYEDRLYVEVETVGLTFKQVAEAVGDCPGAIPPPALPVTLTSFNAQRVKSKVTLKWETASESNNSGFEILRKVGNGAWQNVAFVPSQANGGNSSSVLTYEFNDVNTGKGISQYRLRQVDRDKKASFSEIRSVRGFEEAGKLVIYPNPSSNGKVNLVFEDKTTSRNVLVSDMSGRIIKQYRNISNNSLVVDQLENGVYNIHITDLNTATTTVEKVIVNKR